MSPTLQRSNLNGVLASCTFCLNERRTPEAPTVGFFHVVSPHLLYAAQLEAQRGLGACVGSPLATMVAYYAPNVLSIFMMTIDNFRRSSWHSFARADL